MKKFFCTLLAIFFLFVAAGAVAAEPLVITENQIPDQESLINALALKKDECRRMTVNMKIHFDLDSSEITAKSAETLDAIGKAMQAERLQALHFDLEGHTDASGSENYNQKLSEKRAMAVKYYLVARCGVTDERLTAQGRGESDPEDPNPLAEANRRVNIYSVR
ncbi:MAG: OmpA family protein [Deltaproteobacteria bacterium]|nr:OmpA family protein [Deltaproteobacteria bacterium]